MAFLGNVFTESVKVTRVTCNSIRPVSSPKRGNLDTGVHTRGRTPCEDAKIRVVHPQALESRKPLANKQKPGEEHGADFLLKP